MCRSAPKHKLYAAALAIEMAIRILALVVLLWLPSPQCAVAVSPPLPNASSSDLAALLSIKAKLTDPQGILGSNWSTGTSFCDWVGISCSRRQQRVTALVLSDMPLEGELAPQIGNLSSLSVVNLTNTNITSAIPSELGRLCRLQVIGLRGNRFSGAIPTTVGNLTRLRILDLSRNNFSGMIPSELHNMHNLEYMNLMRNGITGPIPNYLFNDTRSLKYLNLANNSLTGSIPQGIGSLPILEFLNLENNQFSDSAPPQLFNISTLKILGLGINKLHGPIPDNNGSFNLPMLQIISLYRNNFTGPIPSGLSASKYLEMIYIQQNCFTGVVPTWLGTLSGLTFVSLGLNHIVGSIPASLGNLTRLDTLDISSCNLTGQIPWETGQMSQLTYLDLSKNQLTGFFPDHVGNLSKLSYLRIDTNQLTGPIPHTLGNAGTLTFLGIGGNHFRGDIKFLESVSKCRHLWYLDISMCSLTGHLSNHVVSNQCRELQYFLANDNMLTGTLPNKLSNMSDLRVIDISKNQLTKEIPEFIMMMDNLENLNLAHNKMFGSIPSKISMLTKIGFLSLSDNSFSGPIPEGFGNISMLQFVWLSRNKLTSAVPSSLFHPGDIIILDLSENFLTGALPYSIGNLIQIEQIDLSANHFISTLPDSIGQLQMVTFLNLSQNKFSGSIPPSFEKLFGLKTLDLSSNNLSGTIPEYFANFNNIKSFNISFNKLEGQIPSQGIFSTITLQSLMGNAGLCGAPRLGFSPCSDTLHSTNRRLLKFGLPAISIAVLAAFACIYSTYRKKDDLRKEATLSNTMMHDPSTQHMLVSYYEIVQATNNFSEDNLLGLGSFSKVFRGQLRGGLVVAIKVFNMELEHTMRSFEAECRVLHMARHRNLIRILSTCSNQEFKAIILPYMPNGNLEAYLHSDSMPCLGFLRRLDVILDVALALEYLHHQHYELILHCDLKPSNVLFDTDMTAHVSDFGIAKLLNVDGKSIATASMPGTIGYMAPEYGFSGKASRKSDVFSYGIMLLEVFSRKKPTEPLFAAEYDIRQWVQQALPSMIEDIVDNRLLEMHGAQQNTNNMLQASSSVTLNNFLVQIFEMGLVCSSDSPSQRMTMCNVVAKLTKIKSDYSSFATRTQRAEV